MATKAVAHGMRMIYGKAPLHAPGPHADPLVSLATAQLLSPLVFVEKIQMSSACEHPLSILSEVFR